MTVLHLTRDFPPPVRGGISSAVGGLVAHGGEAAVLSFDAWRPRGAPRTPLLRQDVDGHPVLRLSRPRHMVAARAYARDCRPTLLHVHDPLLWDFAHSLRDDLAAPALYSAHVVHRRLNQLRGVPRTASGDAEARAVTEADAVHAPSPAARTWLGAGEVLPWGVEATPTPAPAQGPALVLSRFDGLKGLHDVLAMPHRARPVEWAGGLPTNPRGERRWAARIEASPGVRWLGWLSGDELEQAWARCSVALVPSHAETFGLVCLEALARGRPLVAARCGGPESFLHEGNSWLVDPGHPGQLAEALAQAATAGEARNARVAEGLSTAASLRWSQVALRWRRWWRLLADEGSRRR